ncbi:MAG TPA: hypothetical protein VGI92_06270 [Gemmatimonadales bacterium]|jgi:hypothetical protein
MLRGVLKAAIVAIGVLAAAPLSAQSPAQAPAPQRSFVARQGRMSMSGPRHRRFRRRHGRRMGMRRGMRGGRPMMMRGRMGMARGRMGMARMRMMRWRGRGSARI